MSKSFNWPTDVMEIFSVTLLLATGRMAKGAVGLELEDSKESKSGMSELSDVIELEFCGGSSAFSWLDSPVTIGLSLSVTQSSMSWETIVKSALL